MITGIVFSKDRACQLDLFFQSVNHNAGGNIDIVVLYDFSSPDFEEGYEKLKGCHPFKFVKQSDFYNDIKNILIESKDCVSFFTDDDLVYQKIPSSIEHLERILECQIACFSLRMGMNTIEREFNGKIIQDNLPKISYVKDVDGVIAWDRTSVATGGYWSYPLSVDGHIFRKSDMVSFVDEIICWTNNGCCKKIKDNPNSFEAILQRFYFELPIFMTSFDKSVVVNSPNNRVQDDFKNYAGEKFSFSQEYLNQQYLDGHKIDFSSIDFSNIKCPHQELDLCIIKNEA